MTCFGVITEISSEDNGDGNYAVGELLVNPNADTCVVGSNIIVDPPKDEKWESLFVSALAQRDYTRIIDLRDEQILFCYTPVFRLGEIMVMDSEYGRTIPDGRKPSKWFVTYETFDNIEDAVKRAKEVTK